METTVSGALETRSDSQPLSVQIVRKVADEEGTDPTALDASLYDVIDPEALDELFEARRNGTKRHGTVEFVYHGYRVVVESDDSDDGATISLEEATSDSADLSVRSDAEPIDDSSHYCLNCDWALSADEEYSTSEQSGLAISHHVETGHTIETPEQSGDFSDGIESAAADDTTIPN